MYILGWIFFLMNVEYGLNLSFILLSHVPLKLKHSMLIRARVNLRNIFSASFHSCISIFWNNSCLYWCFKKYLIWFFSLLTIFNSLCWARWLHWWCFQIKLYVTGFAANIKMIALIGKFLEDCHFGLCLPNLLIVECVWGVNWKG